MGRLARRLALGLFGLLLLLGLVLLVVPLGGAEPQPAPAVLGGRAATQQHGLGALRAGAATVPLHPIPGGPVAGYPAPRSDDGSGAPIAARALVLQAGGVELELVSLPLLLISSDLEAEVVRQAGLPGESCLLLAATHTHSGPGGFWDGWLGEVGGVGRFSPERRALLATAAAEALVKARAALRPARLLTGQVDWPQGPSEPRGGHNLDPALTALRLLDDRGQAIAQVVDYAMHPTVVPRRKRGVDGDWPEVTAALLEEQTGAPALVLQGAVGDATWSRNFVGPVESDEAVQLLGRAVARRAAELLAGQIPSAALQPPSAPGAEVALGCTVRVVALPVPEGGRALPWPLRRPLTSALRLGAPRAALVVTLELPGLVLAGVPGEPVGELGLGSRAGGAPRALVGLADGYVGYVETEAHAAAGSGESLRSWYGPGLAAALGLR